MNLKAILYANSRIFKDSVEMLDHWSGENPIKLVRGAYLHEEPQSKVTRSKDEADEMYDSAVARLLVERTNSIMLATHNHRSIVRAWHIIQDRQVKISSLSRDVCFAQLYGMGDDLTHGLLHGVKSTPENPKVRISVVKYIPYGTLDEVMPYLARRAWENRGMLGGSMLEREALYGELKTRLLRCVGIASVGQKGQE